MPRYIVTDTELTGIANAIRAKTGESDQLEFPGEFVSGIRAIETPVPDDANVFFWDPLKDNGKGGVYKAYTAAEFLALTEMPPNPDHSDYVTHGISIPMTSQGWNWTLADAKAYVTKYGWLNIGQMYAPTDGKTHFVLYISDTGVITKKLFDIADGASVTYQIDSGEAQTASETVTSFTFPTTGWHQVIVSGEAGACKHGIYAITSAGNDKFYYNNVKEIYISPNDSMVNGGFINFQTLEILTIPQGITAIGDYLASETQVRHIVVPDTVASLGRGAGKNNGFMISFSFPKQISISDATEIFGYDVSLRGITLPEGITTFGGYEFASCNDMEFVVIPDGVLSLSYYSLDSCAKLKHVYLPTSITSIGPMAFRSNYTLKSFNRPVHGTPGSNAFYRDCNLESIELADATSIGQRAFDGCGMLTEVILPATLTDINQNAFIDCCNLQRLVVKATTPPTINANSFTRTPATMQIIVPTANVADYQAASNWSSYSSQIVGGAENYT